MKIYIKILRQSSLHLNVIFEYLKFHVSKHIIKLEKYVLKSRFSSSRP